jgi:hypothetical protein
MRVQWGITTQGKQDYRIALVLSGLIVAAFWLGEIASGPDMEGEAFIVYTVLPVFGWLIGALCLFVPIRLAHVLVDLIREAARAVRASS